VRKIIVGAMVSMDGVMQAPGAPREDPTKGFNFGGWVMPYFDQEFGEELDRVFKEKFDLLLGRKTTRFSPRTGRTTTKMPRTAASRNCSTRSRNTRFRARARSIRAGRTRCSSATSPT
jgi:hypothetical protein